MVRSSFPSIFRFLAGGDDDDAEAAAAAAVACVTRPTRGLAPAAAADDSLGVGVRTGIPLGRFVPFVAGFGVVGADDDTALGDGTRIMDFFLVTGGETAKLLVVSVFFDLPRFFPLSLLDSSAAFVTAAAAFRFVPLLEVVVVSAVALVVFLPPELPTDAGVSCFFVLSFFFADVLFFAGSSKGDSFSSSFLLLFVLLLGDGRCLRPRRLSLGAF